MAISQSTWDSWYRRTLPAYWIFLFCCTHFPRLDLAPLHTSDKVAHMTAFGLLAFFWWRFCESGGRRLSGGFVWNSWFFLAAYAALDEYLQQFVGRSMDTEDWLADNSGMIIVLALLEWQRKTRARRMPGRMATGTRSA